jgi:hypothetical protein
MRANRFLPKSDTVIYMWEHLSGHMSGVEANALSVCGGQRTEEGGREVVCMCLWIRRSKTGVRPGKEKKTRQRS